MISEEKAQEKLDEATSNLAMVCDVELYSLLMKLSIQRIAK